MHKQRHSPRAPVAVDDRRPWTLLVLLCAAQFMVILDATVVNVALPSIRRALGFTATDLQWVVTAYLLATGGLLLLGGRAADLLGRRRIFLTGLGVFTTASLLSGLAASPGMLIASRAAQGAGAALLSPAALSIVTTSYAGAQRARALSTWGAIGGAGAAAGVLLGGVLTSWLGWRSVFFVNVPVGVTAAALTLHLIPRDAAAPVRQTLRRLDLPGAATLVAGLVVLVYAIQGAAAHGWGSVRTVGLLGGAVALLAAFASIERQARHPLITPSIWRMRSLVSSAVMMLGVTAILVGTSFLNTLFFQTVLGASALKTGSSFSPASSRLASPPISGPTCCAASAPAR
jgi:EmrB/QacA subfamily drug resistance transporter